MATPMVSPDRARAERHFFTGITLAMMATVIVGFSRSFFLRPLFPNGRRPPRTIFYVHGVVFTAWIVLLVTQASLSPAGAPHYIGRSAHSSVVFGRGNGGAGHARALIAARRTTGFVNVAVPPLQFSRSRYST